MTPIKNCNDCGREYPHTSEHFGSDKSAPTGLRSICKPCMVERSKRWHSKNPNSRIEAGLKLKFGITLDQYNEMFNAQEGKCKICDKHQLELKRRLAVDHCHATGKIRGLLCYHCNVMLGHGFDSRKIFQRADKYMEEAENA